ncbi:MAG: lactate utilization protein [Bacteroidia bacterium]|nr:lactate utilization protein [Bacteroidia bacterium]
MKRRHTLAQHIDRYDQAVNKSTQQYQDFDLVKSRAAYIRAATLDRLDEYLLQFEEKFSAQGGKVIWAEGKSDARQEILSILHNHQIRQVAKSQANTHEEVELAELLAHASVNFVETELGSYLLQSDQQKPYHMLDPILHLSKSQVFQIAQHRLHYQPDLDQDAQKLTHFIRESIRPKLMQGQAIITGADFLIADTGSIAISENQGNVSLGTAFAPVHIVLVGIDQILPQLADLDIFWPLLATSRSGQTITPYNLVLSGPRQTHESDGPTEMYVILLDNGRSQVLADPQRRSALRCIHCGACHQACPVYKSLGSQAYPGGYQGPIGAVITPLTKGFKKYHHLSFASTLCGACAQVCPVKIDLPQLLRLNREQSVREGLTPTREKMAFRLWRRAMQKRKRLNRYGARMKKILLNNFLKDAEGWRRSFPEMPRKSFHQIWKELEKDLPQSPGSEERNNDD